MRLDWQCSGGKKWRGKMGVKEEQEGRGQIGGREAQRGGKRTKGAWEKEGSTPGKDRKE